MSDASHEDDAEVAAILERFATGAASAPVTVMELLLAMESVSAVEARLRDDARWGELSRLVTSHRAGCDKIVEMLASGMDDPARKDDADAGISAARRLFDYGVGQSEAASVALYSLGSEEILAEATAEIVDALGSYGVLGETRVGLDLGCGIGRILAAIAPRLAFVHGTDIAPKMVETATRRLSGAKNVELHLGTGHDLAFLTDASVDVVVAVDVFPYIVQSGDALVRATFAEIARVLARGGDFVLLNFSYRGDEARDVAEVRAHAQGLFDERASPTRPFRLWNGTAFRMARADFSATDVDATSAAGDVARGRSRR